MVAPIAVIVVGDNACGYFDLNARGGLNACTLVALVAVLLVSRFRLCSVQSVRMVGSNFKVAGTYYLDQANLGISNYLRDNARIDDTVQLVPDPDNEHDKHAIRVMHGDRHVGYVPRNMTHTVSGATTARVAAMGNYDNRDETLQLYVSIRRE